MTPAVRLRWVGRTLRAEREILVDPRSSVIEAHDVAVAAEHALIHAIPRLAAVSVHADPLDGTDHHALRPVTRCRSRAAGHALAGHALAGHGHQRQRR